jgi:hypothetical protein
MKVTWLVDLYTVVVVVVVVMMMMMMKMLDSCI